MRSQQRTARAQAEGWLAEEITAVQISNGSESITVDEDEHPRPKITLGQLAKLKPLLGTDSTITAGNASGINDGACALLLASAAALNKHGLQPLARIIRMAAAGVASSARAGRARVALAAAANPAVAPRKPRLVARGPC